ncbi:MAG: hypothetical protein EXS36_14525 [Pedosphaera sp.]|nr:hypothetical protein [Pedosphaera sp.]
MTRLDLRARHPASGLSTEIQICGTGPTRVDPVCIMNPLRPAAFGCPRPLFSVFAGALLSISVLHGVDDSVIHMLVPGFRVEELPISLSNQNNLRFAPDGTLTSLGYDGRIWRLQDSDGDGLEDTVELFWDQPTLSVPVGMEWGRDGLYVSSKGKVSRLVSRHAKGRAEKEEIIASGWPATDVGSGGVDATAVTLDAEGNVYFGLLVADYSNAYRLRKWRELKPEEREAWIRRRGKPATAGEPRPDETVSIYDLASPRGTIQKWNRTTGKLETLATGIRVPYGLQFNQAGDLFNTDQEGETWMPNGNPLDEFNHIQTGLNYGFPPPHPEWLPKLVSEPPAVAFGPQHQSACGFAFNEPESPRIPSGPNFRVSPGRGLFGPAAWKGNAIVVGESRAKLWRIVLGKTPSGYVGRAVPIARISMLTTDVTISPSGDLYVSCHSGPPDWGTGPQGAGRIFRIRYVDREAPQPVGAWPESTTEVRVTFDRALDDTITGDRAAGSRTDARPQIEFGSYVTAGDRFEVLKPPYAVVTQQDATPRGRLHILSMRLEDAGKTVVLTTDPHPFSVTYALTLPGVRSVRSGATPATVDLEYDFSRLGAEIAQGREPGSFSKPAEMLAVAPQAKATAGTDSRAAKFDPGDWEHGRELFHGTVLQCGSCHRVRGDGALTGPDLSNLNHRDSASVLRDIREPNATLHPDYVTYLAVSKNGTEVTGFLRSAADRDDSIILFDGKGGETRLARSDIAALHPTGQSLMPSGLLDAIKPADVKDLLTFLLYAPPASNPSATLKIVENSRSLGKSSTALENGPRKIVLVASKQDHGPGQHDYPAWQKKWARLFATLDARLTVETAWEWPSDNQFQTADTLVFYFWNHDWSVARFEVMDRFQARGGGLVLLHAAVIADRDPEALAERIGLSAQPGRTGYRHMPIKLRLRPKDHPLLVGLPESIPLLDEPYWPLVGDPGKVTVLGKADVDGGDRPLIWTFERGRGRVFASIPGHYNWTLDDSIWRILCLRGIAWTARLPIAIAERLAVEE